MTMVQAIFDININLTIYKIIYLIPSLFLYNLKLYLNKIKYKYFN